METTPTEKAREAFGKYAGYNAPDLPSGKQYMSAIQVKLCRWQVQNFGAQNNNRFFMGMVEELGELSHAMLKHEQRIRGMQDRDAFLEAAGDAAADLMVFLTQLCTNLRMDVGTLYVETAKDVMKRDWKTNPNDAHEHHYKATLDTAEDDVEFNEVD